jgi:hypothetical protein
MNIDTYPFELNFTPKFGYCNDFRIDNTPIRKIIWLVPHVIKHKENSEIITWRCNWGNVCKSKCLYAMSNNRTEKAIYTQDNTSKEDIIFTSNRL